MLPLFVMIMAIAFIISMVSTVLMRWASPQLGLVDHPGERKIHRTSTPSGGGVAVFLGVWIPIAAAVGVCLWLQNGGNSLPSWPELAEHVPGVLTQLRKLGIVFVGALIIWLLGLADDRWGLSPWLRLAIHLAVGGLFVASGMTASIFIESATVRALLTIFWVAGLINAFNMLDNMDGLSAGVGIIIAGLFAIVAVQTGQYFIAAFLACLVGALGGFLLYNFPPASIFMGDSGGTLIGYLLAAMTIQFTFFTPERPYFPVLVPLLMFGLPLFDTVTVVWIRLREGRSPFHGDTNHFSHRLVALGMSARQAVLTIYLVTATVALGATVLYYATSAAMWVIFAQALAVFAIIGMLERAHPKETQDGKPPSRRE